MKLTDRRFDAERNIAHALTVAASERLWVLSRMRKHLSPKAYQRERRDIRKSGWNREQAILKSEGLVVR